MKLIKSASGKTTIKMSKKEWQLIGKKAGWVSKKAGGMDIPDSYDRWKTTPDDYFTPDPPECPECFGEMEEVQGGDWKCLDENCEGYIDTSISPDID